MPTSGPVMNEDVRYVLPEKDDVYNTIEGTIAHFKLVMEGLKPPPGAVYSYTEGGNGEMGFYIVSDGGGQRPPASDDFQFDLGSALSRVGGD